jgi:beta-glucosidase
MLGHGLAVQAMRSRDAGGTYGITLNLYPVDAATDAPADVDAARRVDAVSNRIFLDPLLRGRYPEDLRGDVAAVSDLAFIADGDEKIIAAPLDVLGVNYYSRHVVRASGSAQPPEARASAWVGSSDVVSVKRGLPTTEMGWEIDPQGLYDVLSRVQRDYGPIPLYITENGAAFADRPDEDGAVHDPLRIAYLDEHFRTAYQAIQDGIDLRGYFVWTLLDNFEWAWGFAKRFGLVYVDYPTQRRVPKDSARWFAGVTRDGLPDR